MGELFDQLKPIQPFEWTGERFTTDTTGQVEVEHLHRYFIARHLTRGLDVLDIASGEGYGSAFLAQTARSVVGVEIDQASVEHARAGYPLGNLRFELGSAQSIPLPDRSVDAVVSFETIEHFYEQEQFLKEVRRVLRPGGTFIVSSPNRDTYSPPGSPSNPHHVRELTRNEFEKLLSDRFGHVALLGQRPIVGSVIVKENGTDRPSESFTFERRGSNRFEASTGFDRVLYYVAIASDAAIPPLPESFYFESWTVNDVMVELPALREAMADKVAQIARLETVVPSLQKANAEKDTQIAQFEAAVPALQKAVTQLEAVVPPLRGALADKDSQIAQLKQNLRKQEEDVAKDVANFSEQLAQLKATEDILRRNLTAQREEEIAKNARLLTKLKRFDYNGKVPLSLRGMRNVVNKKTQRLASDYRLIASSPLFDAEWYLGSYPDVAAAKVDAAEHYLRFGAAEGRNPGPNFTSNNYLRANPDVAAAGYNPLVHFLRHGVHEGRNPGLQSGADRHLGSNDTAYLLDAAPLSAEPSERHEDVDVIVCVHNALDDVRNCLQSVIAKTLPPYRLILVDDGSHAPTREYLQTFSDAHGAILLRHDVAKGYTYAANAGLRASTSPFCVLLNSDTEVPEGWLDRLMEYMRRDPAAGIVGPLSNTASWQSIPLLFENGDWASNPLPQGIDAKTMARLVSAGAHRRGIPLGFINGFCMLLRQEMLRQIGIFDEEAFGAGYGEENDLCIRARQKGWRLLVAEDVYVFHHQSRSYGDRRQQLSDRANKALAAKHSQAVDISPYVEVCRDSLMLRHARLRVAANVERTAMICSGRRRFETRRIAFILPVADAGGGANVVIQEIRAMRRFGVDAWLINRTEHRQSFERSYPNLEIPVIYAGGDLTGQAEQLLTAQGIVVDAIVATAFESFYWLPDPPGSAALGYYVQDMETLFFAQNTVEFARASKTYTLRPDVVRVTKSNWNRAEVIGIGGHAPAVVGPSIDMDIFYPRNDDGIDPNRSLHIVAMVRPETPRRAPARTLRILRRLKDTFGSRVSIGCFGASLEAIKALGISLDGIRIDGALPPGNVAELLGRTDIFLDFSDWQAMGLTALEAMASGAAIIVPRRGGAPEFCRDGEAGLVVDTRDEDACFAAAERLVTDAQMRLSLRHNGMNVAAAFLPELAALKLLDALWGEE